jgi:hypothetical protein
MGQQETEAWKFSEQRQKDHRYECWRCLGYYGWVRAVYQDKEQNLCCSVELFGPDARKEGRSGCLVELYATHLKVIID